MASKYAIIVAALLAGTSPVHAHGGGGGGGAGGAGGGAAGGAASPTLVDRPVLGTRATATGRAIAPRITPNRPLKIP